MASNESNEPFPPLPLTPPAISNPPHPVFSAKPAHSSSDPATHERRKSSSPSPSKRRRTSSLTQSFLNSSPPYGMWQATGEVASKIPTLGEIRNGSFSTNGWTKEGQMEARGENPHQIQGRRNSRASSLSTSRRRRSTTSPLSARSGEAEEYFPAAHVQLPEGPARVPSTIPEAPPLEGAKTNISSRPIAEKTSSDPVMTTEIPRSSSTFDRPSADKKPPIVPDETGTYPNGYRFPPKHTWWQSTVIGLKAFWKFFLTPFGFLITIYALNIVAWGAMLFFVLLNAAPAMCKPSCNDDYSARKIWIEIDSQILNGLFCVTGFGLIPWRFRDFYYLTQWRVFKKYDYFRRLAGHNRSWFRLPGSDKLDPLLSPPPLYNKKNPKRSDSPPEWPNEEIAELEKNPAIPLPVTSMPPAPLTGVRAPPTKPILLDVVVWMYILNTVFQACLAGAMWGLNRFTRPGWVTGFLISIGCVVAMVGGLIAFFEGKKIKKVEGVPVEEEEVNGDVEKTTQEPSVGKRPEGEKALVGVNGHVVAAGAGAGAAEDGKVPARTREKIRGKHWYERH